MRLSVLWQIAKKLPSALEAVEDVSEKGEEVGVGWQAPTPPFLKSHPVVVKKIKSQQSRVPPGEVQPSPCPGHGALCAPPLYPGRAGDLGSWFLEKLSESMLAWLPCLWDIWVDGIILSS